MILPYVADIWRYRDGKGRQTDQDGYICLFVLVCVRAPPRCWTERVSRFLSPSSSVKVLRHHGTFYLRHTHFYQPGAYRNVFPEISFIWSARRTYHRPSNFSHHPNIYLLVQVTNILMRHFHYFSVQPTVVYEYYLSLRFLV